MNQDSVRAASGSFTTRKTPDGGVIIELSGRWLLEQGAPTFAALRQVLKPEPSVIWISYDTAHLEQWDSSVVSFLVQASEAFKLSKAAEDRSGLPPGLRRLVELAVAVPERSGAAQGPGAREALLERIGISARALGRSIPEWLAFVGRCTIAFVKLLAGKARYRTEDLMIVIQQCGAEAVGIVTLISFLVGAILAFMGAVQLAQFGASIYVADLVGIGMAREMGAMMTAIIMSGRTGAAFAAQLGSMKVSQEIDALTTMGISPFEFLVLPRMIALVLMMPLLCAFSDVVGMLGGAVVGVGMLDVPFGSYYRETIHAVSLTNFALGLSKSAVYGLLIAVAGCFYGFKCGSSSSAVGDAATGAVVSGIVMVVVACGIFAVIANVVGI